MSYVGTRDEPRCRHCFLPARHHFRLATVRHNCEDRYIGGFEAMSDEEREMYFDMIDDEAARAPTTESETDRG